MYGHEYLEFEIRPDGLLRYANHSNYKKDTVIRKQATLSPKVLQVFRNIVGESQALSGALDDRDWPIPDRNGAQELEIVMNGVHLNVSTAKINSLVDIQSANKKGKTPFFRSLFLGSSVNLFRPFGILLFGSRHEESRFCINGPPLQDKTYLNTNWRQSNVFYSIRVHVNKNNSILPFQT